MRNMKYLAGAFFLFLLEITQINAQKQITVNSIDELQASLEKASPGDKILLEDGNYTCKNCTIQAKGAKNNTIIIIAKNRGKAIILSEVVVAGDFISLEGLSFKEAGCIIFSGKGCRLTRSTFNDTQSRKWVRVFAGSSNIEIDHNVFQNKTNNAENEKGCQLLQIIVRNQNEQHHVHHNLFKDIAPGKVSNGYETVQLITERNPFDPPPGACNSIIENNLFIRCNGEPEVISVKSNGNIIRQNTFRACRGALVLRHGDDNTVTQNYFFGDGEQGSGGVRLQGSGQTVANNYFYELKKFGVGMMDGTPDDLYVRVENANILFNTFINCNNTMTIGLNHPKHPNGAAPKDCNFAGNIFVVEDENQKAIELVQGDEPENFFWESNVIFGSSKQKKLKGFIAENPHLKKEVNNFFIPTDKSISIKTNKEISKIIEFDLFGKKREVKKTVGAIQYPVENLGNGLLTEDLVGPEAK